MPTQTRCTIAGLRPFVLLFFLFTLFQAEAQNKQGLGPGGSRLTPPPAPSSGTGFGANRGFGPGTGFGSSGGGAGSNPPGTRCVSIQCADGTVVPCNSSCPRPGASSSTSSSPSGSAGGAPSGGGSYAAPQGNYQMIVPPQNDVRRDEQERQRREEFERGRDRALGLLKGVEPGEMGIKGFDGEADGLKDAPAAANAKGKNCGTNADPSMVDLCDRNASKPIDPRAVKGKQRISEKTLTNDSYVKGFDAIRERNYEAAVDHFKMANAELGEDFFVKMALALAHDLVKSNKQKARMDQAAAAFHESKLAVANRDYDAALKQIDLALALESVNPEYKRQGELVRALQQGERQQRAPDRQSPAARAAVLAGESRIAIVRRDWTSAAAILDEAHSLNPYDPQINQMIRIVKEAQQKRKAK